jgi:hypothetical protein
VIKLSQAPINKSQLQRALVIWKINGVKKLYLAPFVINHHVVWLHVAVHDAFGVTEIQRLPKSEKIR